MMTNPSGKRGRVVAVVSLLALAAAVLWWRAPSPTARRLNSQLNHLPLGAAWFAAVVALDHAVDQPLDYVGPVPRKSRSWRRDDKLQVARRLLRDHATSLLPGLRAVLQATPPRRMEEWEEDDLQHVADAVALLMILDELGDDALPLVPDLLRLLDRPNRVSSAALHALCAVRDPHEPLPTSAVFTLASSLSCPTLDERAKHEVVWLLACQPALPPAAHPYLAAALANPDRLTQELAARALGFAGDPTVAMALVEQLTPRPHYDDSNAEILAALGHLGPLAPAAQAKLAAGNYGDPAAVALSWRPPLPRY